MIVYSLFGIVFLWMFVAMFPSIQSQSQAFTEMIANYPEGFLKAFGISEVDMSTIEGFLSIEQFSIVWPIMAIFLMVSFAGISLSGAIEKGTMEIVLAKPVSRLKIFFGRYVAGLVILIVFTICSILAIIPLCKLYDVDYELGNIISITILGFLFAWAIFSMAMMFSAIFSEKSKTYMTAGGIMVIMYVLNLIASLKDNLADLKYASFFYYFDYTKALMDNSIDGLSYWVFGGTIVICTIIGVVWFWKRDIAV